MDNPPKIVKPSPKIVKKSLKNNVKIGIGPINIVNSNIFKNGDMIEIDFRPLFNYLS